MDSGMVFALVVVAILAVIFAPLITIWALNTLFGTAIQAGLGTWFATLWLSILISARTSSSK